MTTIAWDGKTLAGDSRANSGNVKFKVSKIRRHRGHLIGFAGPLDLAEEVFAWFKAGANPEDFPPAQTDEDVRTDFLVITPKKKIHLYQKSPYPVDYSNNAIFAIGSGRDFALAAMHLGKTADQAVAVAGLFDHGTNAEGVETLCLDS